MKALPQKLFQKISRYSIKPPAVLPDKPFSLSLFLPGQLTGFGQGILQSLHPFSFSQDPNRLEGGTLLLHPEPDPCFFPLNLLQESFFQLDDFIKQLLAHGSALCGYRTATF
jgi:hypothetical protein